MQTTVYKIKACSNHPIGDDWEAQLHTLLGSKPRRLSRWGALGLFGALSCVRQTGHNPLSSDVAIRVYTESGTRNATYAAMAQASEHLPMPFSFMQTQPGQLFTALGTALAWHGDGYTTSCTNLAQAEIALLQSIQHAALLAWVEEEPVPISRWIWLEKTPVISEPHWQAVGSIFETADTAHWLKIDAANNIFQAN